MQNWAHLAITAGVGVVLPYICSKIQCAYTKLVVHLCQDAIIPCIKVATCLYICALLVLLHVFKNCDCLKKVLWTEMLQSRMKESVYWSLMDTRNDDYSWANIQLVKKKKTRHGYSFKSKVMTADVWLLEHIIMWSACLHTFATFLTTELGM